MTRSRFAVRTPAGRLVRFGDPRATILPGTAKGRAYCARSAGINRGVASTRAADPWTPNNLSRALWGCYPGPLGVNSSLVKARRAAARLATPPLQEWK